MDTVLSIESLDLEGRGISRQEGKVIFVEGALTGETVSVQTVRRKPSYEIARVTSIHRASSQRVTPQCPHFGVCGGCAMQHLDPAAQVAVKQRALEDAFKHLAKLRPDSLLPPIHGPNWGYRYRARLTARLVPKKGGMLVGFHERKSSFVADMQECHVLPRRVSDLLLPLRHLLGGLSRPDRLPQIEVAVGEEVVALVLRHLEPLSGEDLARLREFGRARGVQWWLQPKGPDTVHPLDDETANELAYALPDFGLHMPFRPTDFTQVNHAINRVMIRQALSCLDLSSEQRVLDLFCGLGNFSLPLATRVSQVVGVEGSQALTERAQEGAVRNGLAGRTRFETMNLFEVDAVWLRRLGRFDRYLIDPPREGAQAVCEALATMMPEERPERLVYVSCNPASLARDAAILVHRAGYRLRQAGVINMFPHTGHVESMAVFVAQ